MAEVSLFGILKRGLIGLLVVAGCCPLLAQALPDASVSAALRSLHARAGAAFVGEVVGVRRLRGVVEVEFSVEQAVKGEPRAHYVLREWGGLWAAGQRRFWVGERALVFLQEPGPTGLSSPVDGMEGVLPVSTAGQEVDVERLRARVDRRVGASMSDAGARLAVRSLPTLLRERLPKRPVPLLPNRALEPVELERPELPARAAERVEGAHDIR